MSRGGLCRSVRDRNEESTHPKMMQSFQNGTLYWLDNSTYVEDRIVKKYT